MRSLHGQKHYCNNFYPKRSEHKPEWLDGVLSDYFRVIGLDLLANRHRQPEE
jgi:hypothetical protein